MEKWKCAIQANQVASCPMRAGKGVCACISVSIDWSSAHAVSWLVDVSANPTTATFNDPKVSTVAGFEVIWKQVCYLKMLALFPIHKPDKN